MIWAAPPRNGGEPMLNEHYNTEAAAHRMAALRDGGPRKTVGIQATFPRVLVIMANFSNYSFVSSRTEVDSMFNAQNWTKDGATGSVRQYFYDQSNGAYNPQFDIVGPVTLSQNYAYYGAGKGTSAKPGYMVTEACALVDSEVDFGQYDLNNDGKVDMVFVLFAGFGENDPPTTDLVANATNLVWPHYWTISAAGCGSNQRVFDGKTVNDYEVSNELDGYYSTATNKVVAGIGVLVHEFCHGLGLPDLYSTSSQYDHKTWGCWSVMDYGPYNNDMHTPPSLSAYERYFLGWLEPTLLNEPADITLSPLSKINEAGIITSSGQMPSSTKTGTFWMVENRRRTGWDIGLPGNGLLLSQIKSWASNGLNNNANNMAIDILEADGITDISTEALLNANWFGKQGDLYPYYTLDSIKVAANYPITQITKNNDGTISMKVCGGKQTPTELNDKENVDVNYKFYYNGQIYIRKGNKTYNLFGHETTL